ncbi:MAG: hypothetical protein HQK55_17945 [Deltaproteobacteria bacterium]|nr:hypothetical protein [Deltaproteobacteria bacterium]
MDVGTGYPHPLLHLKEWREHPARPAEKVQNLSSALDNLRQAIATLERFLT